jgi:hypothetical protein
MYTDIDIITPLTWEATYALFVERLKQYSHLPEIMKKQQETVAMFWNIYDRFNNVIHEERTKIDGPVSKKRPLVIDVDEENKLLVSSRASRLAMQLVTHSGPTFFLEKLIAEFDADCNTKNKTGCSILMMALWKRDVSNMMVLLDGDGLRNMADPSMQSILQPAWSYTTPLHVAMYVPIAKLATKTTPATPPEFMIHPVDNEVCNVAIVMVKHLLGMGANQFDSVKKQMGVSCGQITDCNGHSIASLAADSGSVLLLEIFYQDAVQKGRYFDINQGARPDYTRKRMETCYCVDYGPKLPLLCVGAVDSSKSRFNKTCNFYNSSLHCKNGSCNGDMFKWLIEKGANPHTGLEVGNFMMHDTTSSPFGSMCLWSKAVAGLSMYHRSVEWKITVLRCLGPKFMGKEGDVVPLILKFAGIGESYMADAKTPWIPSMPVRTADRNSWFWGCCYSRIDAEIEKKTKARLVNQDRKRKMEERERRMEMGIVDAFDYA